MGQGLAPMPEASPAYQSLFWRPFLGNAAFALWDVLRALDLDGDGFVEVPATIKELAQMVGSGDRHTILGRPKTKTRPEQVGALARLVDENLVRFTSTGPDRWHRKFHFWVIRNPPMLIKIQVDTLPEAVKAFHTRFVGEKFLAEIHNYYTKHVSSHSEMDESDQVIKYDQLANPVARCQVAQYFNL
jgi:hypothetical protein